MKYIAKKDTWFDEGTEAELIAGPYECYKDIAMTITSSWGLFLGIKDGKPDSETCPLDEFDIIGDQC